jgi:hypothetical protein
MATVELPSQPLVITGGELRDETNSASTQVDLADAEATAARATLGEALYSSWVAFRDDFRAWKRSLNFWELYLSLNVAGVVGDWERARSYRLQAINWRQRIAAAAGVTLADPSADVRPSDPTDLSWIKWAAAAVIVVVVAANVRPLLPR